MQSLNQNAEKDTEHSYFFNSRLIYQCLQTEIDLHYNTHSMDSSVEIIDVQDGITDDMDEAGLASETMSPRLSQLKNVFDRNRKEREDRVQRMRNKQESEKAHALYLKCNATSRYGYDRARPVVQAWAQINGRHYLSERQRQRLMELETVDRRNQPVRQQRGIPALNVSNNADDYKESCTVIGCGITFTCAQTHKLHNKSFRHSPCNPLLHMPNGRLTDHPLGYVCPKCGESYQRSMDCQEHMVMSDHLSLFSPLSVCAYMCPQCLQFFPEQMRCHNHMEECHHFEPAYPFSDDLITDPPPCPRTIPVPSSLAEHFIQKVKDLDTQYCVKCVECGLQMHGRRSMAQHFRETEGNHLFTSSSQISLAEVFAEYLGDRSCDTCLQILQSTGSTSDSHQCTTGLQGKLVDINCKSFMEFVRRTGLTLEISHSQISSNPDSSSSVSITTSETDDSSIILVNSAPNSPLVEGFSNSSSTVSTSSCQGLNCDSPSGKKRGRNIVESSSNDGENNLTQSPFKRKRLEHVKGKTFLDRMSTITKELNDKQDASSGFDCASNILDLCDVTSSSGSRNQSEDNENGHETKEPLLSTIHSDKENSVKITAYPGYTNFNTTSTSSTRTTRSQEVDTVQIVKIQNDKETASFSHGNRIRSQRISVSQNPSTDTGETNVINTGTNHLADNDASSSSLENRCTIRTQRIWGSQNPSTDTSGTSNIMNSGTSHLADNGASTATAGQETRWNFSSVLPTTNEPSGISSGTSHLSDNGASKSTQSTFGHEVRWNFRSVLPSTKQPTTGTDPQNLDTMRLVIFLDLDNWGGFFKKLPRNLPEKTFVWAFFGGKNLWKPPRHCAVYEHQVDNGCMHLHDRCGSSKDAADFAICLTVGKMDERLGKHIPFAILSGDKGFLEVERQMALSTRRTVVIDPHNVGEKSGDVLYTMIVSVMHG